MALIFLSSLNKISIVFCMDGVDVFKLFASDFGTVSVFAGERMINMMMMMMMMIQDDDEKKMCR